MADTFGFVGLGTMGMPTVATLARAGFSLVVHDVRAEALSEATALAGVAGAGSPREVAERCECVFAFLPQPEISLEVFLGKGGIVEAARDGLVACDHSSLLPSTAREIAAALGAAGIAHVDAPVLGGGRNCADGTLTVIASGDEAAFERVRPAIETISNVQHFVGVSGTASAIKVMQNALGLVQTTAIVETLAVCRSLGIDPQLFFDVVAGGGGMADTNVFATRWPRMVARDYAAVASFVDVPAKDSALGVALAEEAGVETPVLRESMRYFQDAKRAGWGRRDTAILANVVDLRRKRIEPDDV